MFTLLAAGGAAAAALLLAVKPAECDAPTATKSAAPLGPVEITGGAAIPKPPAWNERVVASLSDAHDLLDALEARGVAEREFEVLGKVGFVVRWR
ncbi:hypothetical protein [Gemmata sp.]|uniref:hypothetical protein n=1 Tax=Gemmata sp. TaxID=1914242 RepID=UPI003F6E74AF